MKGYLPRMLGSRLGRGEGSSQAAALTTPLPFQIRKYPSFKRFFNEFSDASLRKLVATLDRQKASLSEEGRSLANRPPPCAFGTLNKFAVNRSCAICTLMQSRGEYKGHSYAHFLSRKAQQVRGADKDGSAWPQVLLWRTGGDQKQFLGVGSRDGWKSACQS